MFISAYAKILNFKTLEKSFHSKNCHKLKKNTFSAKQCPFAQNLSKQPYIFFVPKVPKVKNSKPFQITIFCTV